MSNKPPTQHSQWMNIGFRTGFFILSWLALILLVSTTFFVFHGKITIWNFVIPTSLVLLLSVGMMVRSTLQARKEILISLLLAFLSISIPVYGCSLLFDISWDGQDYQQKSIIRLNQGFNPIYQTAEPVDAYDNVPFNHYPDGPWVLASTITRLTGNLESGKAITWISMLASFWICLAVFLSLNQLTGLQSLILAGVFAFNPVAIYQSLSYYVDALVSSYLLLACILLIYLFKNNSLREFISLAASILIGLNIKFTGTAYMVVLMGLIFCGGWFIMKDWGQKKRVFLTLLLSGLVGIGLVGFHPFMINWMEQGSPLYPITGGNERFNQAYIMSNQSPDEFVGQNGIVKLYRSIFSVSGNLYGDVSTVRKLPFSVSIDEIKNFISPDIRIGGFGPLFSGILLFSALLLAVLMRWDLKKSLPVVGICLVLFGSTFINPENWWARYSPQIWFIPCVILLFLFLVQKKRSQAAGWVLALLICMNLAMIVYPYYLYNIRESQKITRELSSMSASGQEYLVFLGPFTPWRSKLDTFKVKYQTVPAAAQLPCPEVLQLIVQYSPVDCSN